MSLRKIGALLPAAIAFGLSLPAAADDALYAKIKSFLPPGLDAKICFARTYDAKHLQKHPKQKVTEIVFFLRYTMLADDERAVTASGDLHPQDFRYDYTLAAKVKGTPETLYASGECGSTTAIACSVECDGGGVELEPKTSDPYTLLIRLDTDYTYIRMTPGCGDESEAIHLEPGEDDKLFKLSKVPLLLCQSMQENLEKRLEDQYGGEP
ncbi:MAG: hypothetical protein FJX44_05205 [Alphaproteobacteria bacterium]|nr:hypothetical protein [Alphaproteobacteria bacterium]